MLGATVHKRGDATIVRCQGRFVTGADYTILRKAVLDHTHAGALILDMAQVERVDAGGLGVLLRVREGARSKTVKLKLLNVTSRVREVFELTRLLMKPTLPPTQGPPITPANTVPIESRKRGSPKVTAIA